jgi:hypothetical protein
MLICHSIKNAAPMQSPATAGPPARWIDLTVATGPDLNNAGGPARDGIRLFSHSNLLPPDHFA